MSSDAKLPVVVVGTSISDCFMSFTHTHSSGFTEVFCCYPVTIKYFAELQSSGGFLGGGAALYAIPHSKRVGQTDDAFVETTVESSSTSPLSWESR